MSVKGHNQEKVYTQGTAAEVKCRAVMQIFKVMKLQAVSCQLNTRGQLICNENCHIFQTII